MAAGMIESHKVAILAALSIADEYLQAKEDLERMRAEMGSRVEQIAAQIEGVVPN